MKNEKGITLIALVITVIIMLILAGVAISALTGDGGLFDKTLKSAEAYENAAQKEAKQLDILMNEIDGYIGDLTADKKAPSVAKLEVSNITDTEFTLTATGKDNVGISKYEFYIKNDDGSFTLEKTIESEDTTVTYDVTGKDLKQNSYTYKLKVYDKAGNSKESSELLIEALDTTAPTVATLVASDITDNGFTLTAKGEDDKGIVKYEFYIKDADGSFKLERTMEVTGNTATYNVTGKTPKSSSYEYKVIVYDKAGNSKESDVTIVGVKKLSEVVKIGNYVKYDAGIWTQEDIDKITSSPGNPKVQAYESHPTSLCTFGKFKIGNSRGMLWRIWDVNDDTGVTTLISISCPEYYKSNVDTSNKTINILKNRNCEMYVNDYATEAHILTGQEFVTWYNKNITDRTKDYTIVEGSSNSNTSTILESTTLKNKKEPISVLNVGVNYWLATYGDMKRTSTTYQNGTTVYNSYREIYYITGDSTVTTTHLAASCGIRILVTLKSDVLLDIGSGDGSAANPWKLAQ